MNTPVNSKVALAGLCCMGSWALVAGCATEPFGSVLSAPSPPEEIPPAPARTIVHRDIVYESPGATRNHLDLQLPLAGFGDAPTLIVIHGGGWLSGDKSSMAPLCELLSEAGFPTVACNYTLSTIDTPGYPQTIFDVKAVVRWIRTEGAEVYGLSKKVVVVGDSAGGYLALMLGTTDGNERFEPHPFEDGYRVEAVISFFAPGDLVHQFQFGFDYFSTAFFLGGLLSDEMMPIYIEASPITYINENNPPMTLLHGWADETVPFEASMLWQQAVASVCRYCPVIGVQDAGHGFDGFGGIEGAAEKIQELLPKLLDAEREPDLNGDGVVDQIDLGLFVELLLDPIAYYEIHAGCNKLQADQDEDGLVDGRDVMYFAHRLLAGGT